MTLIDGDRIVTAQLYDDEHEEFTEKKMSIIDFVNEFSDEGVTTADDVLDKIRAEIKALSPEPTAYDVVDGNPIIDAVWETLADVLQIIDKYKERKRGIRNE